MKKLAIKELKRKQNIAITTRMRNMRNIYKHFVNYLLPNIAITTSRNIITKLW